MQDGLLVVVSVGPATSVMKIQFEYIGGLFAALMSEKLLFIYSSSKKLQNKRIRCLVWNAGPDSDVIKVSALRRQKDDEIRRLIASKSILGNC